MGDTLRAILSLSGFKRVIPLQKTIVKSVLCSTLGILIASCGIHQQQALSSDEQVKLYFTEHQAEFENLKITLLAEKQQRFVVQFKSQDGYTVSPHAGQVTVTAIEACKKLMREIDADKVVRNGSAVCIRVRLIENAEKIEEENIVFDDNAHAVNGLGLRRDSIVLGSGWIIVKDRIDLRTGAINLK